MTFRLVTWDFKLVDYEQEEKPTLYKKYDYVPHSLTPIFPENQDALNWIRKHIGFSGKMETSTGEKFYPMGFLRSSNRDRATLVVEVPSQHIDWPTFLVLPTYKDPNGTFPYWFEYTGNFNRDFFPDRLDKIEMRLEKIEKMLISHEETSV